MKAFDRALVVSSILLASPLRADVLISDFNTVHPLNPAITGGDGSWGTPVSQVTSFTSGGVTGQQVAPFEGGNPGSDGSAFSSIFATPLNIQGNSALALTARLLVPGNQVTDIAVTLWSDPGQRNFGSHFTFHASDFSGSEFRTMQLPFTSATDGNFGPADFSAITEFAISGNGIAGQDFQVQFSGLSAVPEPSAFLLLSCGAGALFFAARGSRRSVKP
jgi:hypothetical protein